MLVILTENGYLYTMAKWSEKHMYNWIGWMRSLNALYDKILTWTVTPTSLLGFFVFVLNITIGSTLLGLIVGLMAIPQTLEWIMRNIGDEVDKLGTVRGEGIKHNIKEFIYLMLALFVLIPFVITWGLPKLIMEIKQRRVEKRFERHLQLVEEDRRRWDTINEYVIWARTSVKKDFKPKMKLKAHRMVEPRHSIAFGSRNVAIGYYSINRWPNGVTMTTHNNINNE